MSLQSLTAWTPPRSCESRHGIIRRQCKRAASRLRRREVPAAIARAAEELAECRVLDAQDQAEEREDYFLSLEWSLS
jgi:hypothetical protein